MRIEVHIKCCICGGMIEHQHNDKGEITWIEGHNAAPVKDGRCCQECNSTKVIPKRMESLKGKWEVAVADGLTHQKEVNNDNR